MELVGKTFFYDWEVSLMVWIQSHLGSFGADIASFFSMFGESMVAVAVLGFLYWCYDKQFGIFVGLNVFTANVWNTMIKNIVVRRRPYFDNKEIQCLKPVEKSADIYDISAQGYSFPSGHSTTSTTVFGSLPVYKRKNRVLLLTGTIIPILVGISRFCVGVHYPTDVLCGWALGLVTIILLSYLQRKIKNEYVFYALIFVSCLPGFFFCKSNDYYTSFGLLTGFLAAIPFERKYVKFENTTDPLRAVLRVVFGAAIYFGLNSVLKLPFSSQFLDSGTAGALAVRAARYSIVAFVDMGIYPMIFKHTAKIGRK